MKTERALMHRGVDVARRAARVVLTLALLVSGAALGCSDDHGGDTREGEDGALQHDDADAGSHDAAVQDAGDYTRACGMGAANPDSGSCQLDRRLLECKVPGGSFRFCLFESCSQEPGFRIDRCHDLCAPDELAAICGGIGPNGASNAPPDPACHDALITPGGIIMYCCPCATK
jgi:hypothetical protein